MKRREMEFRFQFRRFYDENGIVKFRLVVGLRGYLPKEYIPVSDCAYAKDLPLSGFEFDTRKEAQDNMHLVKEWFKNNYRKQNKC